MDLKIDEGDSVQSINALRAQIRELTKARNEANLKTEEGRAQVQQLNEAIDRNNAIIKANQDALTKQRMNVGNYKADIQAAIGPLDQFTGGLASSADGFMQMTKQALVFMATPIGAVITALGLAVGALTAYFKGSEEGQDRLAKITSVLNVAFDQLTQYVEKAGELIFDLVTNTKTATETFGAWGVAIDIAFAPLKLLIAGLEQLGKITGISDKIEETVKLGEAIAEINDRIEARENELIVLREETDKRVAELREKAIKAEGQAKLNLIEEAVRLEKELSAAEAEQSRLRLEAFDLEVKEKGNLTEEEKNKRAELQADIINDEAQAAQSTIRLQKELEKLYDEKAARDLDREQTLINDKALLREQEREAIVTEGFIREELEVQVATSISDKVIAASKKTTKEILEDQRRQMEGAKQKAALEQSLQNSLFAFASQIAGRNRVVQSGLAVIQTYLGASKAFTSQLIAGDPSSLGRAQLAAAIAIIQGLGRVAAINAVGFAQGGLIRSNFGLPITRANGDNILATVKTGEVILNERQQAMLGGARTFRAIGVPGFAEGGVVGFPTLAASNGTISPFDFNRLAEIIANQPVQVAVQDINAGQARYAEVVNRAEL